MFKVIKKQRILILKLKFILLVSPSIISEIIAKCHGADCHYAEDLHASCHYADDQYAKCPYAECHYDERHGAKPAAVVHLLLDFRLRGVLDVGQLLGHVPPFPAKNSENLKKIFYKTFLRA